MNRYENRYVFVVALPKCQYTYRCCDVWPVRSIRCPPTAFPMLRCGSVRWPLHLLALEAATERGDRRVPPEDAGPTAASSGAAAARALGLATPRLATRIPTQHSMPHARQHTQTRQSAGHLRGGVRCAPAPAPTPTATQVRRAPPQASKQVCPRAALSLPTRRAPRHPCAPSSPASCPSGCRGR